MLCTSPITSGYSTLLAHVCSYVMDLLFPSSRDDERLSQSTQDLVEARGTAISPAEGEGEGEEGKAATDPSEEDKEQTITLLNDRGPEDESGDAMELEEESRGEAEGEAGGGGASSLPPFPSKIQRFYFESDTLALKNNPE